MLVMVVKPLPEFREIDQLIFSFRELVKGPRCPQGFQKGFIWGLDSWCLRRSAPANLGRLGDKSPQPCRSSKAITLDPIWIICPHTLVDPKWSTPKKTLLKSPKMGLSPARFSLGGMPNACPYSLPVQLVASFALFPSRLPSSRL